MLWHNAKVPYRLTSVSRTVQVIIPVFTCFATTAASLLRRIENTIELADVPASSSTDSTPQQSPLIVRLCHRCFARMDVGRRIIFVWTILLFVLLFLVVYLDGGLDHETLIFFSLLWFFDFLSVTEVVAGSVKHYRALRLNRDIGHTNTSFFDARKTAISIVLLLLKIIFELCLYGHLRFGCLSLVWVMFPLWLFLVIVIAQLSIYIVHIHQKAVSEENR